MHTAPSLGPGTNLVIEPPMMDARIGIPGIYLQIEIGTVESCNRHDEFFLVAIMSVRFDGVS